MSIDYVAVLADLEERRAKLDAAIAAIREIMATTASARPAISGTQPAPSGRLRVAKKQRTGTVASIAHELIKAHGGPMKVSDIVRSLQGMGKFKTVDARSNYGTVFGTLNDDRERFVKAGEGMFEIRERASVSPSNE